MRPSAITSTRNAPLDAIAIRFSVGSPFTRNLRARRILVCHFGAQAVPLLANQKEQPHMNAFLAQPFRGFHLGRDDSLGIAGASSVHPRSIFGRRDEWRDRIHVGGEDNRGPRLFGEHREDIAARAFDRNFLRLKASPEQFAVKEIAHRALVAGDGLDVHELTGEGDDIHARQDTSLSVLCALRGFCSLEPRRTQRTLRQLRLRCYA